MSIEQAKMEVVETLNHVNIAVNYLLRLESQLSTTRTTKATEAILN